MVVNAYLSVLDGHIVHGREYDVRTFRQRDILSSQGKWFFYVARQQTPLLFGKTSAGSIVGLRWARCLEICHHARCMGDSVVPPRACRARDNEL